MSSWDTEQEGRIVFRKINGMAERELIKYISELAAGENRRWLELGIGDDAAVLRLGRGGRVVATTDMVVEGTHYKRGTPPEAVGRKAVARSLSDLAAMAARPLCVLAAVCFPPRTGPAFCRRLCRALWETSCELGAPLVGGDISSGTDMLAVTVTALGVPSRKGVVRRSGARPGDCVCVTGALGGSLRGRHLTFTPRIAEALELVEKFQVHAMIDVSDGLSTDARHIAEQSGVGMVIEAGQLPVHADVRARRRTDALDRCAILHGLNDGEDYELVFCVPESDARRAARRGAAGTPVTVIGRVTRQRRCVLRWPDGTRETLRGAGWEHLGK
jgi:thiamine-monophosphate kinase